MDHSRQTLKSDRQFILQKLDILDDILVRPFTRYKVPGVWKQLADEHSREIRSWCFDYEILRRWRQVSEGSLM